MSIYLKNKKILEKKHSYYPSLEHDACGVGLIASTEGKKSRAIVEYGIEALKADWHRGALDADGNNVNPDKTIIKKVVTEPYFPPNDERSGEIRNEMIDEMIDDRPDSPFNACAKSEGGSGCIKQMGGAWRVISNKTVIKI